MANETDDVALATLGGAVFWFRELRGLTQDDLAVLMRTQGVDWRREQVVRVEAGQRQVTAHELYMAARVLGVELGVLYGHAKGAGYDDQQTVAPVGRAFHEQWQDVNWSDALRARLGEAHADLSPGARALLDGDTQAARAVRSVFVAWAEYERKSGRPPSQRAKRAKRATLWAEYEQDPDAFRARAANGSNHE